MKRGSSEITTKFNDPDRRDNHTPDASDTQRTHGPAASRENDPTPQRFLDEVPKLIREAGDITRRYFRSSGLGVQYKADASPVTDADRETENHLRRAIGTAFPGHNLIGEEFGGSPSGSVGWTWIIDPIDGTKSFIHGIPLYTVLIALMHGSEFVGGAIHNPVLDETVVAVTGRGCFFNGDRCRVRPTRHLPDASICVTDFADLYRRAPRFAAYIMNGAGMARTWADGYAYLLLATGRIDVALDPIMSLWDVAPVVPVVREAGGIITQWDGTMTGAPDSAIAATPELHAELLAQA